MAGDVPASALVRVLSLAACRQFCRQSAEELERFWFTSPVSAISMVWKL